MEEKIGVLIVDDDRMIAEMMAEMIDGTGLADWSAIACTRHEVEDALKGPPPSIVFLDILLEDGLMGAFVGRRFRERNENAVIVVVTGHAEELFSRDLLDLPIDDYLLKPFSEEKLTSSLIRAYTKYKRRIRLSDCLKRKNTAYERALAKLRELEDVARKLLAGESVDGTG